MRIIDRIQLVVIVRDIEDGKVVGESQSQPLTVFGVDALRELCDTLPDLVSEAKEA